MSDKDAVKEHAASVDFVLSTIPIPFDLNPYLSLVKHDGRLVSVGMLEPIHEGGSNFATISMQPISVAGSMIGSICGPTDKVIWP